MGVRKGIPVMPIKFAVAFSISLIMLGASYAFAGGILNESHSNYHTRGVGNYALETLRDPTIETSTDTMIVDGESNTAQPENKISPSLKARLDAYRFVALYQ
jgi:hypothetical protein